MANGGTIIWPPDQLTQWRVIQQAYLADTSTVLMHQALDQRRLLVQQAMIHVLQTFLHGSITLHEFNVIFQQKTHTEWNAFNMRGMSGGMFLNKLVKYITDRETLTTQLRSGFRLPEDTRDGQRQMQALTRYLERLIALNMVTRAQLQPSRVPFLLSAWWHLQDVRRWPIFFPLVQHMLIVPGHSYWPQNPAFDVNLALIFAGNTCLIRKSTTHKTPQSADLFAF